MPSRCFPACRRFNAPRNCYGFSIQQMVEREVGNLPFLVLFNKKDLKENIEISAGEIPDLQKYEWKILRTNAKTGERVKKAFQISAKPFKLWQKTMLTEN